jgi:hypothetical protein
MPRGRPKLTDEQKAISKQKYKEYQKKFYAEKGKKDYELARDLLKKHREGLIVMGPKSEELRK